MLGMRDCTNFTATARKLSLEVLPHRILPNGGIEQHRLQKKYQKTPNGQNEENTQVSLKWKIT